MTVTFEPLNDAAHRLLTEGALNGARDTLRALQQSLNAMQADLDAVAERLDSLVRERTHIVEVLSAFYRSDITMSSLQPVLDLCCELNPTLRMEPRR